MAEIKTVLTDQQVEDLVSEYTHINYRNGDVHVDGDGLSRAIEAAVLSASAGKVDADQARNEAYEHAATIADKLGDKFDAKGYALRIRSFIKSTQQQTIDAGKNNGE